MVVRLAPVQDIRALDALAPQWALLHRRCVDATPFQAPEWLVPWWRYLGDGTLYTFGAYALDDLVAVLPFYIWRNPEGGARTLLPLGAGTSDYLDVTCAPECRDAVASAFAQRLDRDAALWDTCDFVQLRAGSMLLDMDLPARWRDLRGDAEPCPVVDLRDKRSLEQCVPARMMQNLRYYRRRAAHLGTITIRRADETSAHAMFDRLAALHGARWSARDGSGVLAANNIRATHHAALPAFERAGMLRLYELSIGDRAAACLYALADPRTGGAVYYYIGGYAPDLGHISPGTLLIGHAMEDALEQHANAFDFLRGHEAYKYLWGARDEPTSWRRCYVP